MVYMEFWIIIVAFAAGLVITCFLIGFAWKFYDDKDWAFPKIKMLREYNALSRVWPTDQRFMSLHFSVFRHFLAGVVSTLLFWNVQNKIALYFILLLNLLYAFIKIPIYLARRRDYLTSGENCRELLPPIKRACFATNVYAFYVYIILIAAYYVRP